MEEFREYLLSFRPQQFAVGGPVNLVINSVVMWIVVNRLLDTGEKVTLLKCALCALLLYVVSCLAIALLLVPTPLMFLFAGFAWLLGSMAVIRGVFQLTYQSGGGIVFLDLVLLVVTHGLSRYLMG